MKTKSKVNQSPSEATVVWAVDPFASDWKNQRRAAGTLKALASKRCFNIQPVYAAPNPLANLRPDFATEVYAGLRSKAQDRLDEMVHGIALKALLPLKIFEARTRSVGDQVSRVLDYAKEAGAEMIVVGTHARKGPSRWFLGSFAETLSLRTDIPILSVNPSLKGQANFKNILFPTDLSDLSYEAFLHVIDLAKVMGSRLRLFHQFYHDAASVWTLPFDPKMFHEGSVDHDELKEAQQTIQKWEKEAHDAGVTTTSEVDTTPQESVAAAILKRVKQNGGLIAMASQSSRLEVNSLGSVTRKVLRGATVPVWVLHPQMGAKTAEARRGLPDDSRLRDYPEELKDEEDFRFPKAM